MNPKSDDRSDACQLLNRYNAITNMVRGGSRTTATSKIERSVIIFNDWKPLTVITKRSILNVAAALDPPLMVFQIEQGSLVGTVSDLRKVTLFFRSVIGNTTTCTFRHITKSIV